MGEPRPSPPQFEPNRVMEPLFPFPAEHQHQQRGGGGGGGGGGGYHHHPGRGPRGPGGLGGYRENSYQTYQQHEWRQMEHGTDPEELSKTNIYIRGLKPTTTDDDLKDMCIEYGEIASAIAIVDRVSKVCKGYGFVMFQSAADAQAAVSRLRDKGVQVSFAKHNEKMKAQEADPTNLYFSNLPLRMDEKELEGLLSPFATIISTRILRHPAGVSRGVGFARLETHAMCEEIIQTFHNTLLPGSTEPLQCRFADSATQRKQRWNVSGRDNRKSNSMITGELMGPGDMNFPYGSPTGIYGSPGASQSWLQQMLGVPQPVSADPSYDPFNSSISQLTNQLQMTHPFTPSAGQYMHHQIPPQMIIPGPGMVGIDPSLASGPYGVQQMPSVQQLIQLQQQQQLHMMQQYQAAQAAASGNPQSAPAGTAAAAPQATAANAGPTPAEAAAAQAAQVSGNSATSNAAPAASASTSTASGDASK